MSDEQRLRYLLWLGHGHHALYGDDGEMQCCEDGYCDFKRGSVAEIEAHIDKRGAAILAAVKGNKK